MALPSCWSDAGLPCYPSQGRACYRSRTPHPPRQAGCFDVKARANPPSIGQTLRLGGGGHSVVSRRVLKSASAGARRLLISGRVAQPGQRPASIFTATIIAGLWCPNPLIVGTTQVNPLG